MGDRYDQDWFHRLSSGELSEEQFAELNQRLRASKELRKQYVHHMQLDALLATENLHPSESPESIVDLTELVDAGVKRRSNPFPYLAGLATLVVAASLIALFVDFSPKSVPSFSPVGLVGQSGIARLMDIAPGTALDETLSLDDELTPGVLHIGKGELTLVFHGGATVQLSGPAELHLLSDGEATLVHGSAQVNVPSNGSRFALNSPFSSHVEEQSIYSLTVNANESFVTLYDGALVVSQIGEQGNSYCSMVLQPMERIRASTDSLELLEPTDIELIDRIASPPMVELNVTEKYVELVKEDRPMLYWRFDGAEPDQIRNEMGDGFVGEIWPAESRDSFSFEGGRATLYESETPRTIRLRDPIPNFLNDAFSIEAWIRPGATDVQSILSFVPESADENEPGVEHFFLFEYAEESMIMHPRNSFRFLYRNPAARTNGMNLFTRGGQRPNEWHHLVATKTGDTVQLYFDGKLIAASGVKHHTSPENLLMYIGQLRYETGLRQFIGDIDEVAVYTRPLPAYRVREHYQAIQFRNDDVPSRDEVFTFLH